MAVKKKTDIPVSLHWLYEDWKHIRKWLWVTMLTLVGVGIVNLANSYIDKRARVEDVIELKKQYTAIDSTLKIILKKDTEREILIQSLQENNELLKNNKPKRR